MLSMAAPERSSATASRWARGADDLFVFFCRRQHPIVRVRYSHDGLAEPMPSLCFIGVSPRVFGCVIRTMGSQSRVVSLSLSM